MATFSTIVSAKGDQVRWFIPAIKKTRSNVMTLQLFAFVFLETQLAGVAVI